VTRRLLNFLTLLSLVLCVGVCVLWVRSYFRWDQIVVDTPRHLWLVSLRQGGVATNVFRYGVENHGWGVRWEGPFRGRQGLVNVPNPTFWNRLGLFAAHRRRNNWFETTLTVPYWATCILLAVLPAKRLRRRLIRLAAIRRGRCPICGYDLRASPDRCPECGEAA
jgi:hypothetical protein